MMAGIEEVLALAMKVQAHAHAPYSGFRVGAVLEADDGSLHVGCNVENASLGLTLCAERGAMAAAVAQGHKAFRRLVLVTSGTDPIPPCGACREFLAEVAPDVPIVSQASGKRKEWRLGGVAPSSVRVECRGSALTGIRR